MWLLSSFEFCVVTARGHHRGGAERHWGSNRLQTSRRLPLLISHPQRTEVGHPGVGVHVTTPTRLRPSPSLTSTCLPVSSGWWAVCLSLTTTARRCCWMWRQRQEVSSRGRGWDAASRSPSASTRASASTWRWCLLRDAASSRASTPAPYVPSACLIFHTGIIGCKFLQPSTFHSKCEVSVFQDQTAQDPSAINMFITGLFVHLWTSVTGVLKPTCSFFNMLLIDCTFL